MNEADNKPPDEVLAPPTPVLQGRQEHSVQFFGETSGLIESVSGYLGEVLEENNVALVVAIPEHREMLVGRLEERGLDMQKIIAEERYVELDAREALSAFLVEGWPDPARYRQMMAGYMTQWRRAAKGKPPRLAILGEMVGLLWSEGRFDAAIRLEQLWNELQETEEFSLRCVYPLKRFERPEHAKGFFAICAEHSHVVPGESYTELRQLTAQWLSELDGERRRIARGLHEGTGQDLAALSMSLTDLEDEARLLNPGLARGLEQKREAVKKMSEELREFTDSIHPALLDEAGLGPALRAHVKEFQERTTIRVELDMPADFGRLSHDREIALYRIVQETLNNVQEHSGSAKAVVRLERDADRVRLSVRDEGKGMPSERLSAIAARDESRLGLRGIRERVNSLGGEFQIVSNADGTEIRVAIRLKQ
jgi:signal transduction histidine kinase